MWYHESLVKRTGIQHKTLGSQGTAPLKITPMLGVHDDPSVIRESRATATESYSFEAVTYLLIHTLTDDEDEMKFSWMSTLTVTAAILMIATSSPGQDSASEVRVGHDLFHYGERAARGKSSTLLARARIVLDRPMIVHIQANTSVTSLSDGPTTFTLGLSPQTIPADVAKMPWPKSARFVTIREPKQWVNCGSIFAGRMEAGSHSICLFAGNVKGGSVLFDSGALIVQAFPLSSQQLDRSGKRLALLVGIDRYKKVSHLAGCGNDVEDMKRLLIDRFEFSESDILTLVNEEATREGILTAFREHLIDQANAETAVVFHYSGHGSQTVDLGGDESDSLDETLVPHDRGQVDPETGRVVRDISDDTLHELLSELSNKTEYLTLVIDSCHSGTITKARGPVTRWAKPQDPLAVDAVLKKRAKSRDISRELETQTFDDRERSDRYVVISGCRPDELSHEMRIGNQSRGALTYYFTNVIRQNPQSGVTYNEVTKLVHDLVSAKFRSQHPQIEGANQDGLIFDIPTVAARRSYIVTNQAGQISVDRGALDGVTVQSTLNVYPPRTEDFRHSQPIATIVITSVGPNQSYAQQLSGRVLPPTSLGRISSRGIAPNRVTVYFDQSGKSSDLASAAAAEFQQLAEALLLDEDYNEALEIVEKPQDTDLLVFRRRKDDRIEIANGSDTLYLSAPLQQTGLSDLTSDEVLEKLLDWAKWLRVVELENPDSELSVELQILPDRNEVDREGKFVFAVGDKYSLEITNKSDRPIFPSIAIASSDGQIALIYPPKDELPEEMIPIDPSDSLIIGPLEAAIPDGNSAQEIQDYVKLIATARAIDLSAIEQNAMRKLAVNADPLTSLIIPSQSKSSKSVNVLDWATATDTYKIVKPPQLQTTENE